MLNRLNLCFNTGSDVIFVTPYPYFLAEMTIINHSSYIQYAIGLKYLYFLVEYMHKNIIPVVGQHFHVAKILKIHIFCIPSTRIAIFSGSDFVALCCL